jgi:hypothetical protein
MTSRFRLSFCIGLCLILYSNVARAQVAAVKFATAPTSLDRQLSLGWLFSTNEMVHVSGLGYYDDGGNGFATDHEIGIFDSGGSLLVSAFVHTGTSDTLIGHFRYTDIPAIDLPAGQSFTLAATTFGASDPWAFGTAGTSIAGFTVDPAISVAANASRYNYQSDNVLRRPGDSVGYTAYFGPNLLIGSSTPSAVPEPSVAAIGLAGGIVTCLTCLARRKRMRS